MAISFNVGGRSNAFNVGNACGNLMLEGRVAMPLMLEDVWQCL